MNSELRRFKAGIFQALAHPTRVALVEALSEAELSPGQLVEKLEVDQVHVSQHLAILRNKEIVVGRREGNQIFYSLRHPVLAEVLDVLKRYFFAHMAQTISTLEEVRTEQAASGR